MFPLLAIALKDLFIIYVRHSMTVSFNANNIIGVTWNIMAYSSL